MPTRINIGCGPLPTAGWTNLDNSWSVKLASRPVLRGMLSTLGFVGPAQRKVIEKAQEFGVGWADVTRHLPFADNTVDAVYSSHVFEHLERDALKAALLECKRVLRPGGVVRILVPDFRKIVGDYLDDGDADRAIERMLMAEPAPKTIRGKIKFLFVGDRMHQWMYDGPSMCKLVSSLGFVNVVELKPGETTIAEPGELDLHQRGDESAIVEAKKS